MHRFGSQFLEGTLPAAEIHVALKGHEFTDCTEELVVLKGHDFYRTRKNLLL